MGLRIHSALARFRRLLTAAVTRDGGNVAMMTAIAAPALLAALGGTLDYATAVKLEAELQGAADAAALAAANQFAVAGVQDKEIAAAAEAIAHSNLGAEPRAHEVNVSIDRKGRKVQVGVQKAWTPLFAHFLNSGVTPVKVAATASFIGSGNICVLALAGGGLTGVHLNLLARVDAQGCGVYANTESVAGIRLDALSKIQASVICSAGGVVGLLSNMRPAPVTDCPKVADPLAARVQPEAGACDHTDFRVTSGTARLQPGVYCGGLMVGGTAQASFAPGTYVIKDGPLLFRAQADAEGRDVGFFLTGDAATLAFRDQARVRLSGPESGVMAGILIFEDRAARHGRTHLIRSTRAEKLEGTIYLPRGTLLVDPNATVAQESAYTAIIADRLSMTEGPTLVLKSNYDGTSVPVPSGIRSKGRVLLSQ